MCIIGKSMKKSVARINSFHGKPIRSGKKIDPAMTRRCDRCNGISRRPQCFCIWAQVGWQWALSILYDVTFTGASWKLYRCSERSDHNMWKESKKKVRRWRKKTKQYNKGAKNVWIFSHSPVKRIFFVMEWNMTWPRCSRLLLTSIPSMCFMFSFFLQFKVKNLKMPWTRIKSYETGWFENWFGDTLSSWNTQSDFKERDFD